MIYVLWYDIKEISKHKCFINNNPSTISGKFVSKSIYFEFKQNTFANLRSISTFGISCSYNQLITINLYVINIQASLNVQPFIV